VARATRSRGPARRCAFCGKTGRASNEHVWPQWLRAHANEVSPSRYLHTAGFTRTAADTLAETPTVTTHQPGSVFNIRARAVCRECNNGWMSALEQQAKPLLLAMIGAVQPGSAITLAPDQAATIATWAIKTAWMREESNPGPKATTQEMRQALHRTALPPEYSQVWAASHAGDRDFDINQASIDVMRHDRPWNDDDVRHVLWTSLTFCGISLLAYTVDGWGVQQPQRDPAQWIQIWPCASEVRFPAVAVTDREVLLAVVNQAPHISLPKTSRLERDPLGPQERRRN